MFFIKKKKDKQKIPISEELKVLSQNKDDKGIEFQEKPRILLIDILDSDFKFIQSKGFNCTSGTLGNPIEVPNTQRHDSHQCLLNYDFPPNLHECDIIVIDLQTSKTIPYKQSDHTHSQVKGNEYRFFLSEFPQTVFDPRPYSAAILEKSSSDLQNKESIIIIFASRQEFVQYKMASITQRGVKEEGQFTRATYSFLRSFPTSHNVIGKETKICPDISLSSNIGKLLSKHNKDCLYEITFDHPIVWENAERIKRKSFHPLIQTLDGRIISFIDLENKPFVFLFPLIKKKGEFLLELFQNVLPAIYPNLFPYCSQFSWLKDEDYQLPNGKSLLAEKSQLETEYAERIKKTEAKIESNYKKYSFLHNLLTQTSEELVKTVENYFKWLEFANVTNMDESNPDLKEEDLQIQLDNGLLVVEVKGIAGTSTDSECSQISKIKYRRAKERNSFDVSALYIVNHQRYLPPNERTNPPFNKQQIEDAKNDERGLLSTYELFKLYFYIDSGIITKNDARKALLQHGQITFTPSNSVRIGSPVEVHHNGSVAILRINEIILSKGSIVIISDEKGFRYSKIVDIQLDGKSVNNATNNEIGIKLDTKISLTSELWLKQS